MTTQPRLVNKQFNSPIGLYSEQNVREVLEREQQILANGAIGIDFHNPSAGKPANLQNSAVLRMLEEEENRRGGRTGAKRVAWPPPQEGVLDPAEVTQHDAVQSQGGTHYSNQSSDLQQRSYSSQQTASYHHQQQSYQQQQQSHRPLKPLDVSSVSTGSPLASPSINQSPQGFRPATPAGSRGWAPVHSPVTTPISQKYFGAPQPAAPQSQPTYQQAGQAPGPGQQYQHQQFNQYPQQSAPQQYQSQPFAQSSPSYNQAPVAQTQVAAPKPQPAKQVEPPPSTITLRPTAPVSQAPPMVYSAQPATASLKVVVGGKHLRGDLKWPPEDVRQRMEDEKRQLMELAKGPACKPRRKERDYTPFFAQHALNSTYPGYKIPPGTQFYRPE